MTQNYPKLSSLIQRTLIISWTWVGSVWWLRISSSEVVSWGLQTRCQQEGLQSSRSSEGRTRGSTRPGWSIHVFTDLEAFAAIKQMTHRVHSCPHKTTACVPQSEWPERGRKRSRGGRAVFYDLAQGRTYHHFMWIFIPHRPTLLQAWEEYRRDMCMGRPERGPLCPPLPASVHVFGDWECQHNEKYQNY